MLRKWFLDRHLLPQNRFVIGNHKIDEIFKFGDFSAIAEFLGVKTIPHLNSRPHKIKDKEFEDQMKGLSKNTIRMTGFFYEASQKKIEKERYIVLINY